MVVFGEPAFDKWVLFILEERNTMVYMHLTWPTVVLGLFGEKKWVEKRLVIS